MDDDSCTVKYIEIVPVENCIDYSDSPDIKSTAYHIKVEKENVTQCRNDVTERLDNLSENVSMMCQTKNEELQKEPPLSSHQLQTSSVPFVWYKICPDENVDNSAQQNDQMNDSLSENSTSLLYTENLDAKFEDDVLCDLLSGHDDGHVMSRGGDQGTRLQQLAIDECTYKSEICDPTVSSCSSQLDDVATQRQTVTSVSSYTCTECDKTSGRREQSAPHKRMHARKSNKCTVCNKTFRRSNQLAAHKRVHIGKQPFICTVCNKGFRHSGALSRHTLTHSATKPYECTLCNQAFNQKHQLTVHMHIHTGEKPYVCAVCSKAFSNPKYLTTHSRIHTGERSYQCTVCKKAFYQPSGLTVHMRTHTGEKPYHCTICNRGFTDSRYLSRHVGRRRACAVCSKAFCQQIDLIQHMHTHSLLKPYMCIACNKAFSTRATLNDHSLVHTADQQVVCVTGELSGRSEIHTGENRVTCTLCTSDLPCHSHLAQWCTALHGQGPVFNF